MNLPLKNKKGMLKAVGNFFDAEVSLFAASPKTAAIFNELKTIDTEISVYNLIVTEGTHSKVVSKDESRARLEETALIFAGAIYAYAEETKNIELQTQYDLTKEDMRKKRDADIADYVASIFSKADELGEELLGYDITVDDRREAQAMLIEHNIRFGNVNTGKQSKISAGEMIDLLFEKADAKLAKLDRLMLKIKRDKPEVHARYAAARVIHDKGGSHGSGESGDNPGNGGDTGNGGTTGTGGNPQ